MLTGWNMPHEQQPLERSLSSPRLGSIWLLMWSLGALSAWLLPWAPLMHSGGWPAPLVWGASVISDALHSPFLADDVLRPSIAFTFLILLILLILRLQQSVHIARFWFVAVPALAVFSGVLWSLSAINRFEQTSPHQTTEPVSCSVTAMIDAMPRPAAHATQLMLRVVQVDQSQAPAACRAYLPGQRLRVGDYHRYPPDYRGGQVWQFDLRLRPPHGSANPGGFDYERWLFSQRVAATGSVHGKPQLVAERGDGFNAYLLSVRSRWRAELLQVSQSAGQPDRGQGLLLGLTIGDSDYLTQNDWETLLSTGTNHLLAISGLHVGMVSGLFAWLAAWLWSRTRWCERLPARRVAAGVAVLAAWAYALLAGMSVPTERTALMITILLAGLLLGRSWRLLDLWTVALVGVLLLEPFNVLTAGFWLSFGAVLIMLLWLQYRPALAFWRDGFRLQIILTLALLPIVWGMFDRVAWSSLPANLVAVPVITLVITPLSLLVMGLVGGLPSVATLLMWPINVLASGLLGFLEWLRLALPDSHIAAPAGWTLFLAAFGVAWVLMPRHWPSRYLGLVLCLPALLYRPAPVADGQADIWFLDVGQGLAVVIHTANHAMLYDAGPAFGASDAGERTVVPALRALHISSLDRIVISHHARDHMGGLPSVLAAYPHTPIVSGEPLSDIESTPCRDGAHWQWDGVGFTTYQASLDRSSDNNRSCVLRVQSRSGGVLLTGDIEAKAERALIDAHSGDHGLKSEVLYVPHHGSKTSSSPAFMDEVHPSVAVISAGKFNSFGHPHPKIVRRYLQHHIPLFNTADQGAIEVESGQIRAYRAGQWPFAWRTISNR
jgi:competence protein ComEC